MALVKATAPAQVAAAFTTGIGAFLATPTPNPATYEGYAGNPPPIPSSSDIAAGGPAAVQAVEVFTLGLAGAAARSIASAAPAGWRVFAGSAPYKVVMATVKQSRGAANWKITAAFHGDQAGSRDQVWETLQATNNLDNLPEVRAADYDLRFLIVPGLNFQGFWLAARNAGSTDLFVPFPVAPAALIRQMGTGSVYRLPDVLTVIAQLAQRRMGAQQTYGS